MSLQRKRKEQEGNEDSASISSALQDRVGDGVTSTDFTFISSLGCSSPLATSSILPGDNNEFRTREDIVIDIKEEVIELEGSPQEEAVVMQEAIGDIYNDTIGCQTFGVDDSEQFLKNVEAKDVQSITYENGDQGAIDKDHLKSNPLHGCKKCNKLLHSKEALKIHRETVHLKHMCTELGCGRIMSNPARLGDHMRSVHGLAKVKCKESGCSAQFNSMSVFYLHMKRKHEGNINCEQTGCSEAFTFQREYKLHLINHHDVLQESKCKECEYTTIKGEKNMRAHIKMEHKENKNIEDKKNEQVMDVIKEKKQRIRKKTLKCTRCENTYLAKQPLFEHMRSKHGEPRLQCQVIGCYATFIKSLSMTRHIKKHRTLEEPFVEEEIEVKPKLREERMEERARSRGDCFQDKDLFIKEQRNNNTLKEEV